MTDEQKVREAIPYRQGYDAALRGDGWASCPYSPSSEPDKYNEWMIGWDNQTHVSKQFRRAYK